MKYQTQSEIPNGVNRSKTNPPMAKPGIARRATVLSRAEVIIRDVPEISSKIRYYYCLSKVNLPCIPFKVTPDPRPITLAKCAHFVKVSGHFSIYGHILRKRNFGPGNRAATGPAAAACLDDVCPDDSAGHRVLLHFDSTAAAARQAAGQI